MLFRCVRTDNFRALRQKIIVVADVIRQLCVHFRLNVYQAILKSGVRACSTIFCEPPGCEQLSFLSHRIKLEKKNSLQRKHVKNIEKIWIDEKKGFGIYKMIFAMPELIS